MTVKAGGRGPRRNIPLAKQSKYQNMCPIIEGDITGSSIDKDVHYERTKGMEVRKYLRESCYHCIECSVVNSLGTLMMK